MHSSSLLFAASSAISFLSVAAQTTPVLEIMWKEETGFIGCFDKAGVSKMSEVEYDKYLITRGTCRDECKKTGAKYSALTEGDTCYCGDVLPDEKYITDYHDCDIPCRTYAGDACGGEGYYYIYLVNPADPEKRRWDWKKNPEHPKEEETSSKTTSVQETVTAPNTVVVTQIPTDSPSEGADDGEKEEEDQPMSKAGVAAGVVVGVVIAISLGVGAFLYLRKQKRRKVEDEYRRSVAVREFSKKPEPDLRLDPVMLHRRMSDGSIADNQDYSRRILKVTNPDGN